MHHGSMVEGWDYRDFGASEGSPLPPLLHRLVSVFVVNPVTWGGGLQEEQGLIRPDRWGLSLHKIGCARGLAAIPP